MVRLKRSKTKDMTRFHFLTTFPHGSPVCKSQLCKLRFPSMGPKISHIRKTDLGGQLTEFEVTAYSNNM